MSFSGDQEQTAKALATLEPSPQISRLQNYEKYSSGESSMLSIIFKYCAFG